MSSPSTGTRDFLPRPGPGTLFVDCSTIDVADARTAHEAAVAAGHRALDAPVSGGVMGAQAATLTFMAGGGAAEFADAEPVLAAMGKKSVHCAPRRLRPGLRRRSRYQGDAAAGLHGQVPERLVLRMGQVRPDAHTRNRWCYLGLAYARSRSSRPVRQQLAQRTASALV